MKKFKLLIFSLIILFISLEPLNAASFSISSSSKQVNPNGTFTISVGGDCIGRVDLSVSNGTLSTSSVWVEQGYVTVTVTAGGSGTTTVTASPVTGFSDSDANIYNPGSRSITVSITSQTSGSSASTRPSQTTPTVQKSSDNNLSSITLSEGELSPSFNPSITEYTIELSALTTIVNVNATKSDAKSSIEGTGEKQLLPGNNTIEIIVTAENGSKKTYKLNVHVDDTPQVYLDYKDNKIGIIRNYEGVIIPAGFEALEHTIKENKISLFTKDNLNIIYGLDKDNIRNFYLFDTEKNEILNKIIPLTINDKTVYTVDTQTKRKNLNPSTIKINEIDISCYKYNDYYYLLNVINNEGKVIEYLYETSEGTLMLFPEFLSKYKNESTSDLIIYILSGLLGVAILVITYLIIKLSRGVSNEKNK